MMFSKKKAYFDNTATTRTRKEVVKVMQKYFSKDYANPTSIHESGLIARGSIEMARERIANVLRVTSEELIFTSSGSESNNLAVYGAATANKNRGKHIITSKIEHSSIIKTCTALEKEGFDVTYIGVDTRGHFNLQELEEHIRDDTVLVSLGYVNNEIGTIQDIAKIVAIVKRKGVLLHLDAVQALPYLPLDLTNIGADLVSFSGHKLYAPKGVGLLYIREGTAIHPTIHGGGQEFGLRSGTENVPYAVGLSKAIILNQKEKTDYSKRLALFRDYIIKYVLEYIPEAMLTGAPQDRAPNHVSFCFKGISGKMLVKQLALNGFEVSSGSACSSPDNRPSAVLQACHIPEDYLLGSVRITLGKYNTKKEVVQFVRVLKNTIQRMREDDEPYNNEHIFISPSELKAKLASSEKIQVLDVRHIKYPNVQIEGSLFMPAWKIKFQLKKLDPNVETVVACFQGDIIAPQIQQMLFKNGFANAKVLKGGILNYIAN
ncbi:aminotransferase class V-fold PLP-dependent enzyme [Thermodesulfobacteriota bacterium]